MYRHGKEVDFRNPKAVKAFLSMLHELEEPSLDRYDFSRQEIIVDFMTIYEEKVELTAHQRKVMYLLYNEELTQEETADILNCSQQAVQQTVQAVIKKITDAHTKHIEEFEARKKIELQELEERRKGGKTMTYSDTNLIGIRKDIATGCQLSGITKYSDLYFFFPLAKDGRNIPENMIRLQPHIANTRHRNEDPFKWLNRLVKMHVISKEDAVELVSDVATRQGIDPKKYTSKIRG